MASLARLLDRWQSTRAAGGARLPEYAALAAAVRGLIRDGRLALGVRLPAERELAEALGDQPYDRDRRVPGAARVGSSLQPARGRELDRTSGGPAHRYVRCMGAERRARRHRPGQRRALGAARAGGGGRRGRRRIWPATPVGRATTRAGLPPLREAVARGFSARGLPTQPDQILVTNGVQHAVDLLLRLLVSPGQSVLVESPTYPNVLAALRAHRVRVSTDNLDPLSGWDAGPAAGKPSHATAHARVRHPGVPESHRSSDAGRPSRAAARGRPPGGHRSHRGRVLCGPYHWRQTQLPPVASFDRHARVLTVGGMTKPYWGGLRVGWIRAAAPVIARLAALRVAVDMAGPVLDQLVALRLLDRPTEIIAGSAGAARTPAGHPRRRAPAASTRVVLLCVPGGGVCLWVELDAPVSTALAHAALAHGVRIAPGPRFGVDGTLERYLRVPFTLPETDLTEAVRGWPPRPTTWTAPTRPSGPPPPGRLSPATSPSVDLGQIRVVGDPLTRIMTRRSTIGRGSFRRRAPSYIFSICRRTWSRRPSA